MTSAPGAYALTTFITSGSPNLLSGGMPETVTMSLSELDGDRSAHEQTTLSALKNTNKIQNQSLIIYLDSKYYTLLQNM